MSRLETPKEEIVKQRQWIRTAAVLDICLDFSRGDLYIRLMGLLGVILLS
jgi:hypothetical protein